MYIATNTQQKGEIEMTTIETRTIKIWEQETSSGTEMFVVGDTEELINTENLIIIENVDTALVEDLQKGYANYLKLVDQCEAKMYTDYEEFETLFLNDHMNLERSKVEIPRENFIHPDSDTIVFDTNSNEFLLLDKIGTTEIYIGCDGTNDFEIIFDDVNMNAFEITFYTDHNIDLTPDTPYYFENIYKTTDNQYIKIKESNEIGELNKCDTVEYLTLEEVAELMQKEDYSKSFIEEEIESLKKQGN